MRRALVALALCATLSIMAVLPVSATDYTPTYYTFSLYARGETYSGYLDGALVNGALGRSSTGSFTIPLDLDTRFQWVNIGANYGTVSYDVGASYKFVITLTLGTTGSFVDTGAQLLYTAPRLNGYAPPIDISSQKLISQKGVVESVGNGAWTFTFDNIPYDSVVGNNFFYITTALSDFDSASDIDLYVVSTYFGLMSSYDDDAYKSQILDGLNGIQGSIEDGNNKLDGIQNTLDNLIDDEINKAESGGNSILGDGADAVDVIPDFSESYNSLLNNLTTVLYDASTQDYIPLPSGKIMIMGTEVDILGGQTEIDLSSFLNNTDIQKLIQLCKGLSILACMATSYYWAMTIRKALTSYDAEIPVEVPFLPGGGKFK